MGLLGPRPVADQVHHSRTLATALGNFDGRFLDLGSGGGLPGLVLALAWPEACGVLCDSRRRCCAALEAATADLQLVGRVEVRCGRAESLARDSQLRERFDLVVARSFGPPAVTAECAVGFLSPTARLVVTEPPTPDPARWPEDKLADLGLTPPQYGPGFVTLTRTGAPIDSWPRQRPARSPLW
jgi:16S rRNA (guanine527-N7)-methyltransferase